MSDPYELGTAPPARRALTDRLPAEAAAAGDEFLPVRRSVRKGNAVGSRTGTACPGRSYRPGWRRCSPIQTRSEPSAQCRRCSGWPSSTWPRGAARPTASRRPDSVRRDPRYGRRVEPWKQSAPGVLRLPSGRLVRGRGLRDALPAGPLPQFALYLQGKSPPAVAWESRWLRWPDWWLPADRVEAREALADLWQRAARERVEVACTGGRGRTGTALACLVVLDGARSAEAVSYVRRHYHPRAVETPWQRRYVARYPR